ncbi:MAG: zinc-ribbon domain-containing protein [Rhodobacteraceae bacterium]|nr:zinc-ribbon domain-containing protein [Paracoccaceae bacterium]
MRLTCPNCAAQYEVDDRLIPAGGRDVQCSACGHAWFFVPEDREGELIAPPPRAAGVAGAAGSPQPAPAAGPREAAPGPARAPAPVPAPPPPAAGGPAAPAEARRPGLDPAVAEVLRAEAEREARARRAEAGALESQPDLGLEAAPPRPRAPAPAAAPPAAPAAGPGAAPARRDRLPAIEEINSTLRPAAERPPRRDAAPPLATPAPPAAAIPAARGFRRGFLSVLLVMVLLVALYLGAPRIIAALPAAEGPLVAYVALVDAARLWLHGLVASLRGAG